MCYGHANLSVIYRLWMSLDCLHCCLIHSLGMKSLHWMSSVLCRHLELNASIFFSRIAFKLELQKWSLNLKGNFLFIQMFHSWLKAADALPILQHNLWYISPWWWMELLGWVNSSTFSILFWLIYISASCWWFPVNIFLVFLALIVRPSPAAQSLIEVTIFCRSWALSASATMLSTKSRSGR